MTPCPTTLLRRRYEWDWLKFQGECRQADLSPQIRSGWNVSIPARSKKDKGHESQTFFT